jgi:hypothetical protein
MMADIGRVVWRVGVPLALLALWLLPELGWPPGIEDVARRFDALWPVLAYGGLAWAFLRTLRPGQEPLIARYIRFDPRRDAAACAGYARGLTWFWGVVLGLTMLAEVAAAIAGVDLGWGPDAVLLALFLAEHAVRSLRFPADGIAWPTQTLGAIIRAERAKHG